MAHLFSNYYEKRYKVSMCSIIAIVWFLFLLMAVFAPYFIAWSFGGLWTKQQRFYEEPDTSFTGNLVIAALDEQGKTTVFSSVNQINAQNSGGVPTVSVKRYDNVNNGLL